MLAARAGIEPVGLAYRAMTPLIGLVVEIDRQHRGIAPDPDLAAIGLVDVEDLLVDDVLPAMVLEIARHARLLFLDAYRKLFVSHVAAEIVIDRDIGGDVLHAARPLMAGREHLAQECA